MKKFDWDWDILLLFVGLILTILGIYSYYRVEQINENAILFVTISACLFVLFDFIAKVIKKTDGKVGNMIRIAIPICLIGLLIIINGIIKLGIIKLMDLTDNELLGLNNLSTLIGLGISIICMTSFLNKKTISYSLSKNSYSEYEMEKQLFIFHASAERKTTGDIWHRLDSGAYQYKFLSSELCKKSVEKLFSLKVQGKLNDAEVLGLYYKDFDKNQTAVRIRLNDISIEETEITFLFQMMEDTKIPSKNVLATLGKVYSYHNGKHQLIVSLEKDITDILKNSNRATSA